MRSWHRCRQRKDPLVEELEVLMRKRDAVEDQISRVKYALSLLETGDYVLVPD